MDSNEVREHWAEQSGEYSPDYYAYYGPNETSESIRTHLDSYLGSNPTILELGCSSGRHLSHLHDNGYENLHGVEINGEAFDVMAETYPDLADRGTFYHDAIEEVVGEFGDGQFDAVFSVQTLQHLHPDDEWVFAELARITSDLVITVENERKADENAVKYINDDFPLYFRNWNRIFTDLGLVEVDSEQTDTDVLRAFRTESSN